VIFGSSGLGLGPERLERDDIPRRRRVDARDPIRWRILLREVVDRLERAVATDEWDAQRERRRCALMRDLHSLVRIESECSGRQRRGEVAQDQHEQERHGATPKHVYDRTKSLPAAFQEYA